MQDTLRTRMGWLHAWVGFAAGLLLFCVFTSGCLAVFDTELTRWLQPEAPPQTAAFSPRSLDHVLPAVHDLLAQGEKPFVTLPSARDPYLRLEHHDGHEFLTVPYNPQTGERLNVRATAGGTFFYDLHYTMRSGVYGETVVAFAGLALLLTIGSGIIIHLKGLVSDLMLLRPFAARLRAWLDVHVVAAVVFLPFILLMAYSGTFIRARTLFPPVSYLASLENAFRVSAPSTAHRPEKPAVPIPEAFPPLAPLVAEAERTIGAGQTGYILFQPQTILVSRTDSSGPLLTREHVDFSPVDGHVLRHVLLPGAITHTEQVLKGLHYARWTGVGMRWLYFLSGAMGAVMFASGSIIFLMKRRRQSGERIMFRIAEGLAIGSVVGLPMGALAFFWANRLLPISLPDRPLAEGHVFLAVWVLSVVSGMAWSLLGRPLQGWKIQLFCLGGLGFFLTPLDLATRPGVAFFHVPTVFAATDLVALFLAFVSFQMARRL